MTTTAGAMVDEALGLLESFSLDEEQATTLAADIGPTDAQFSVTDTRGVAVGISPGIVEIDNELLYAQAVNDDMTVDLVPWGRGYKSTTPAAHTAGSRIVSQPTFPRSKILDGLNETLARVFPNLFAVKTYEDTTKVPGITYDLPDDAQWILGVKWQVPGAPVYWKGVSRWRIDQGGGTFEGDGLNGITVDVGDCMSPGQPIRFLYAAKPAVFTSEADVFETVTGLHAGARDVVVLGTAVQSVISQELSRLQMATVEQQNRAGVVAPSAALTSSRFLEQRYQTRLLEEQRALRQLYPPRIARSWR